MRTAAGRPRRRAPALALLLLVAGACRAPMVAPIPLAGPAPRSVVVAPLRDDTGRPGLSALLLRGLDRALSARGYRALPLGVGADLLRQRGLLQEGEPAPDELQAAGRALDVDAVLLLRARDFGAEGDRRLEQAHWDLEYRLLATATGDMLWRHDLQGRYLRPPDEPVDPTVAPDAERPPRPFGISRPATFRDLGELVAALHRAAMDRLPRR